MAESNRVEMSEGAFGDAAVDGLIAGGLAGLPMAAFLAAVVLITGGSVAALLRWIAPGPSGTPVTGALVHLAVAGVYGLLYGLARRALVPIPALRRAPGWLTGAAYGLLVWVAAHLVLLPGANSGLRQLAPALFLAAHLVYGLALGLIYRRR
jgi:hypothetical protein